MRVYNVDYIVAEGQPASVAAIKGYVSEEDAGKAPLKEGAVRLQARAASDLSSLAEPVLAALAAFKAKKGQTIESTPDAIWTALNPVPKAKTKELPASPSDGTGTTSGDDAGKKQPKERAMKTKKKAAKKKAAKAKKSTGPRGEKTLKVKAMLERKNGCTRAEVLEATGWPAISMQAISKSCGLKLRQEKEPGKPTRYFGS